MAHLTSLLTLLMIIGSICIYESAALELNGPNVCQHATWETEYYTENVTYPCWKDVHVSCSYCQQLRRRWQRRACTNKGCMVKKLMTCWDLEERCDSMWVYTGYCCTGFEEDNGRCVANIMCGSNNGGCDQLCRSDGEDGHECECFKGFRLENRTKCVDIDECADGTHECSHGSAHCKNTEGSYICTCPIGYRLTSPQVCEDIQECNYGNGGCEHDCFNTDGAFYCECQEGYRRQEGFYCEEIDECAERVDQCSHHCHDTQGSYACSCPDESYVLVNGTTCQLNVIDLPVVGEKPVDEFEPLMVDAMPQAANISAIVGAVVGILALAVIIVVAIFLIRKFPPTTRVPTDLAPVIMASDKPPGYHEIAAFTNNAYTFDPVMSSAPPAYDNSSSVPGTSAAEMYDNSKSQGSSPHHAINTNETNYDNFGSDAAKPGPEGVSYDNSKSSTEFDTCVPPATDMGSPTYHTIAERESNIYMEAIDVVDDPIYDDCELRGSNTPPPLPAKTPLP